MRERPGRVLAVRCLCAILGAALLSTPAAASDKFVESDTPVFPEVRPDRALVYVVRDEAAKFLSTSFMVFADAVPLGYLRGRTYLSAQVQPGRRLLWGPDENVPQWFNFDAGRTYVLRIDETWILQQMPPPQAPTRHLGSTTWAQIEPGALEDLVRRRKLVHVSLTETGTADLGEHAARKFPDVLARSGGAPTAAAAPARAAQPFQPQSFERIWYRPDTHKNLLKIYKLSGSLTVGKDKVELIAEKDTVSIPVRDIRSVSIGTVGPNGRPPWVIVEYGPPGATTKAWFTPSPMTRDDESVLTRITSAIDAARNDRDLPPIQLVKRAVEDAEALEAGGGGHDEAGQMRGRLNEADMTLAAYLREHPDEIDALFLQVRLDRVLDILTPVVISGGTIEPPDTPGPKRDPQATLDRILELSPGNPDAYYMKARLYGITNPLKGGENDLDKAIQYARRAVETAPDRLPYREALAIYLVSAQREREAIETLKAAGGEHPMLRLLVDRTLLPLPEGAVPAPQTAAGLAQMDSESGALGDFPFLRVSAFSLALGASEVEAFYKKRWKGFRLHELESEEQEGMGMRMLAATFDWRGEELVPNPGKPKQDEAPSGSSLMLMAFEYTNPNGEVLERLKVPKAPAVCQLVIYNWRQTGGTKK